ncbi:ScyD/ScyE family protein [Fodinibius sp.]|uniref:ScyD/ScyE family protein n=1 Tax=Fodinibius sp. TaxID=1872440 RepID=UPI002ACF0497|nr:ScyD/ScyE family protein [Fodinibius sp.]MDZ7658178.1 ScyD/ScyE family protein [Fodinibius sp.]
MSKYNLNQGNIYDKFVRRISSIIPKSISIAAVAIAFLLVGCDSSLTEIEKPAAGESTLEAAHSGRHLGAIGNTGPYEFNAPVFDISATPDGGILVAETIFPSATIPGDGETSETVIKKIGKRGVSTLTTVETVKGAGINGLQAHGAKNFFAASGGPDQAVGAKVYRINPGGQWVIGDIEAYEQTVDVDANKGVQWKNVLCEEAEPFTAGPQSNPYHLTDYKNDVLVADAAGNSLLSVSPNGDIDWVAVFTPPTENGGSSINAEDWMVLFSVPDAFTCYVQPVPTAVAVGPDGDIYVGELTGVTPTDIGLEVGGKTTGLSRVWRIEAGARNVNCPSDQCEVAFDGLTSILDLDFGPDGWLYIVEYDKDGWFTATTGESPAGGVIKRCNPETGNCETVEGDNSFLLYPGAVTFDKWGKLWLLESNIANPAKVRQVALD